MSRTWGNPFRGLVRGGQLLLPNGQMRGVRQPDGSNIRRDDYGQTLLQRGQTPYVVRTEEEQLIDAERGYTWRTDAILSGGSFDLYGRSFNGFVYCAADGSRWWVDGFLPSVTTTVPLDLTLTVRRFGEWGGALDERSISATLADLGQADVDPAQPVSTLADMAVCDITPDGSRALIMLYLPRSVVEGWGEGTTNIGRHPLGWLELTLSGGDEGVTASLTVVRTRAQTLGVQVNATNLSGSGSLTLAGQVTTTEDFGSYSISTTTWQAGSGSAYNYQWLSVERELSITGRLLALWYSAGGGLDEVSLDYAWSESGGNAVPVETYSGQYVVRTESGGGSTVLEATLFQRVTRSAQLDGLYSLRLKFNGAVIDSVTGTATNAMAMVNTLVDQQATPERRTTITASGTVDGQSSSRTYNAPLNPDGSPIGAWDTSGLAPFFSGSTTNMARVAALSSNMGAEIFMDEWVRNQAIPRRYSNNLIALAISTGPFNFDTGSYVLVTRTGPAAHPGGVHADGMPSGAASRWYGSYNPATGEVVRDQAEPVCWI